MNENWRFWVCTGIAILLLGGAIGTRHSERVGWWIAWAVVAFTVGLIWHICRR